MWSPSYLEGTDNDGGNVWYFSTAGNSTPEWYLQDFEAAYGGVLKFDLKQLGGDGDAFDAVDVTFWSYQGGELVYSAMSNPGTEWTHYEIPLLATSGWVWSETTTVPTEAEMRQRLKTFAGVTVRGDYLVTVSDWDTTGLDNVAIVAVDAIPEPTTLIIWSLLGTLAIAVGWWRRRKAV